MVVGQRRNGRALQQYERLSRSNKHPQGPQSPKRRYLFRPKYRPFCLFPVGSSFCRHFVNLPAHGKRPFLVCVCLGWLLGLYVCRPPFFRGGLTSGMHRPLCDHRPFHALCGIVNSMQMQMG